MYATLQPIENLDASTFCGQALNIMSINLAILIKDNPMPLKCIFWSIRVFMTDFGEHMFTHTYTEVKMVSNQGQVPSTAPNTITITIIIIRPSEHKWHKLDFR